MIANNNQKNQLCVGGGRYIMSEIVVVPSSVVGFLSVFFNHFQDAIFQNWQDDDEVVKKTRIFLSIQPERLDRIVTQDTDVLDMFFTMLKVFQPHIRKFMSGYISDKQDEVDNNFVDCDNDYLERSNWNKLMYDGLIDHTIDKMDRFRHVLLVDSDTVVIKLDVY